MNREREIAVTTEPVLIQRDDALTAQEAAYVAAFWQMVPNRQRKYEAVHAIVPASLAHLYVGAIRYMTSCEPSLYLVDQKDDEGKNLVRIVSAGLPQRSLAKAA